MKIKSTLIVMGFLFLAGLSMKGQKSFEGYIKFSTEITTTENAPVRLKKLLQDKYGDSLVIYYSRKGNFRRVHLNSDQINGSDSQIYFPDNPSLYFTYKNSFKIDSLDIGTNTLRALEKTRIESQVILDLDCDCYQYRAISQINDEEIILNYCYSKKTPEINPKFYSIHNDFYLNEFFEFAKRPYLKFSIETIDFKLTYLASELQETKVDKSVFELK